MIIHKVYRANPDYLACDFDLVTSTSYGVTEGWEAVTCPNCLVKRPRAPAPPKPSLQVIFDEVDRIGKTWDAHGQPFEVLVQSTAWVMHVQDRHSGLVLIDLDHEGNILYAHEFWASSPLLRVNVQALAEYQERADQYRRVEVRSFQDDASLGRVHKTLKDRLVLVTQTTKSEAETKALGRDLDAIQAILSHRQGTGPDPYTRFNLPNSPPEGP